MSGPIWASPPARPTRSAETAWTASGEDLVHRIRNVDTVGANTSLARIAKLGLNESSDRRIQIGVVENDKGGIAAELERKPLERRGRFSSEMLTDRGRSGKGQLAHPRIVQPGIDDRSGAFTGSRNNVDNACRDARLARKERQCQRGQRSIFRRLGNHRAAGCKGRCELARQHGDGEVPRGYGCGHAYWFFGHDDFAAVSRLGNDIPIDPLGFFGKPLNISGSVGDFAAAFCQGFALFQGNEACQIFCMLADHRQPRLQMLRPLFGQQ